MPSTDISFNGTDASGLPEPDLDYSCKGDARSNPEVVVDIRQDLETLESIFDDIFGDDDLTFDEFIQAGIPDDGSEDDEDLFVNWVRLPVTKVENWLNKDGGSDITRTARVKFPMVWGEVPIIKFIDGFNSQNNLNVQTPSYDKCRIFFYDHQLDAYDIVHYGYVGGVGPASEDGVGKFWVYDPADLMRGIKVSHSWNNPSMGQVINFAIRGVDNRGEPVGIENRSVFDGVKFTVLGFNEAKAHIKQGLGEDFDPFGERVYGPIQLYEHNDIFETLDEAVASEDTDSFVNTPLSVQVNYQSNKNNMVDMLNDFVDAIDGRWWFEPTPDGPVLTIDASAFKPGKEKGQFHRRYFVDNQATQKWIQTAQQGVRDVLSDFADLADTDITDLPEDTQNAVENFSGGDLVDEGPFENIIDTGPFDKGYLPPHRFSIFTDVTTLNNNAVVDMKPFNTLEVIGESSHQRERYGDFGVLFESMTDEEEREMESRAIENTDWNDFSESGSPGAYTEQYPYSKATYTPLLERADGYEYSSQTVEAETVYAFETEQKARSQLKDHLSEETEGKIEIRGEPHILPHDYLVTMSACEGNFSINENPIEWEVNSVKHVRNPDEHYTTELGVSIAVHDRFIESTSEFEEV